METSTKNLYDRFLEGKATEEEINEIFDRITATPEKLKEFREYERFWEQVHKPTEDVLASLAGVKATIKSYKRRRAWRFVSAATAAAVIVGVVMFRIHTKDSDPVIPAATIQEYVVNVPAGGRSDVALPDGTKVMLNVGSRLSYTSEFNKRTRDVFLSGEGYFEVAHDGERPFNVNTSKCTVTVLGTKFDISAYEQDDETFTALIDGSILFKAGDEETLVSPGELVTMGDKGLVKEVVDVRDYCGWTTGIIKYNNIPFSSLLKRLEREYDTHLILGDKSLGDRTIRVSFSKNDSVETILKVLSDILPISIRKGNKVYYINQKQ